MQHKLVNRRELEKLLEGQSMSLHPLALSRLNALIEGLVERAIQRARADGRKMLMARDMPLSEVEKIRSLPKRTNRGAVQRPVVERRVIDQGGGYKVIERR